eukprot:gene2380-biopygen3939
MAGIISLPQHCTLAPSGHARPRLVQLRAYQSSQASDALQRQQPQQQQQQQHQPQHQEPIALGSGYSQLPQHNEELRQHIEEEYDLNLHHYQPWWLQPQVIIAAGVGFLAGALLLVDEPSVKTVVLAAGPVALFWGIFLFLLPRQFKSFAVDYIETHPEAEDKMQLEQAEGLQPQGQQIQQQQQQQQQQ